MLDKYKDEPTKFWDAIKEVLAQGLWVKQNYSH